MKNLVFLFVDGLRADRVDASLSNISALDKNPQVTALSSHPISASYRASLFTGKSVLGTGVVHNDLRIYPDHPTFAGALSQNGYETAFVGEWMLSDSAFVPAGRHRLGFEDTFISFSGTGENRFYSMDANAGQAVSVIAMQTEYKLFFEALELMQGKDKPFAAFLNLSFTGDIPEEYLEKTSAFPEGVSSGIPMERSVPSEYAEKVSDATARHRYMAYCLMLDDIVGEITATLPDDTIFVLTSSHGTLFAEHGRKGANCFFEEAIRLPFLTHGITLPETLLDAQDLMPTLLSSMGVPIPEKVEGLDVTKTPRKSAILFGMGPENGFKDGREWRGIRTADYTYATVKKDGSEYLFDLKGDPMQMQNLAKDQALSATRTALRYEMLQEMSRHSDTFPKNNYYKEYWTEKNEVLPFLR